MFLFYVRLRFIDWDSITPAEYIHIIQIILFICQSLIFLRIVQIRKWNPICAMVTFDLDIFCWKHSSVDNICFYLIYAFIHIDNSNEYISIRFGFLLNLTDRNKKKHKKCSINSYNSMWQSSCRIKSQRIQFPKCMIGGMDSCEIREMKVKQAIAMEWIGFEVTWTVFV